MATVNLNEIQKLRELLDKQNRGVPLDKYDSLILKDLLKKYGGGGASSGDGSWDTWEPPRSSPQPKSEEDPPKRPQVPQSTPPAMTPRIAPEVDPKASPRKKPPVRRDRGRDPTD